MQIFPVLLWLVTCHTLARKLKHTSIDLLNELFSISYIDKGKSQRNYVAFTYFRILGMDDKTYMIRLGFLRHVECIVHHTKI